jgi:hypothetical protein
MAEHRTPPGAEPESTDETGRPVRRRRWRSLGAVLLLALVFHVPLLRSVGRALMVQEPDGKFDAVVVLGGDHRMDVVEEMMTADQVHEIWMIEGYPSYLVTAEILPRPIEVATAELTDAGISPERLVAIREDEAVGMADFARVVAARIRQAPDTRLLIVCGAFDARYVQWVFDDVLGGRFAGQFSVLGLPYDDFDTNQWWRSRSGLKQVFN